MTETTTKTKTRIAILSRAHMHAEFYTAALAAHPGVALAGVWDEDAGAGEAFAQTYGTPFFAALDALLEQPLDGVIVTSENIHHRPLVEAAARAGVRAILCEKPLATTAEDARAMIAACDAAGARLATAFPCRFSPVFQRLKTAVETGRLGRVLAIRATNHGKCPGGWFTQPEKSGGGAIIDHTVHVADLNRVLLGAEATDVYAEQGNNMYHQPDWEDCGMLSIGYSDGTFATLDTSWSRPARSFPTWGDVTMDVIGTDGTASMDMFRQASAYYAESDGGAHQLGWGSNIDAAMIDEFVTLASGGEPERLATGEDGLKALEVALAAYESARTHRTARIDPSSSGVIAPSSHSGTGRLTEAGR